MRQEVEETPLFKTKGTFQCSAPSTPLLFDGGSLQNSGMAQAIAASSTIGESRRMHTSSADAALGEKTRSWPSAPKTWRSQVAASAARTARRREPERRMSHSGSTHPTSTAGWGPIASREREEEREGERGRGWRQRATWSDRCAKKQKHNFDFFLYFQLWPKQNSLSLRLPRPRVPLPRAAMAVVSGRRLGSCEELIAGAGTFVWGHHIHAAISGWAVMAADAHGSLPVVSVSAGERHATLPSVGDVATCRVLKITPRAATVEILCVAGRFLSHPMLPICHTAFFPYDTV